MKTLTLAKALHLPLDAVSRTFGILAVRGAGKSNTAAVMAEEMFAAGLPFVVIDPVGSWYGLRSSADGTRAGLSIPIFGGKHGDVPLERGAGELLADLVVEKRLTCVLDLSRFDSEADKKAFLLAFAKRLYLKNENPLHLFLEEADDYIPQSPMGDEKLLLRAWENIVRRGRARGLGMTLITQRSAAVAKMVLTQVETLFAMRTTGPQDIAAIEAWVKYHQVGKDVLSTLASLEDGEAWVWSPHYLKTMSRHQIRRRQTFDSGATPQNVRAKDTRPPATLADIDLAALQERMAATIEKAKADDPRELRKRIAELERALKSSPTPQKASAPVREIVEKPVITDAQLAKAEAMVGRLEAAIERASDIMAKPLGAVRAQLQDLVAAVRAVRQPALPLAPPKTAYDVTGTRTLASVVKPAHIMRADRHTSNGAGATLPPARQKILNGLAFLHGIGVVPADKTQLALIVGVSPTSGGYFNNLGALRSEGLIEYPFGGTVGLTKAGAAMASTDGVPKHTEELHEAIRAKLPPPKWRILEALIAVYPQALAKDQLAERIGVSPTSGGYFNNLGSLRSLGLIDYPRPSEVVALPVLFLEA